MGATDTGLYHLEGESWIFYSFEEITAEDNIYSMVFDNDKLHIVAGTYATFYNNSWSGLIEGSENVSVLEPNSIDVAPNGDVWVGTSGGGVFQYDGNFWEHYTIDKGLTTNAFYSIAVDQSGDVWCGTLNDGLIKYDGMNWKQYTEEDGLGGSQEIIVRSGVDGVVLCSGKGWVAQYNETAWELIDECPLSHNSTLYIDETGKIWISDGDRFASYNGMEWNEYSLDNYEEYIASLAVDSDGIVWIGTWESGIYRFDPNPTAVEETTSFPRQLTIAGNYPNPFNPSTTLSYTLAEDSKVTLAVYNLSGQKVATLVDSAMPAGTYKTVFDGTGLASGMYFYRFEAGDVMHSGKMLLMK